MSTSETTECRYQQIERNLNTRGYYWDCTKYRNVPLERDTISFESEWKQFLSGIAKITGITSPPQSKRAKYKSPWEEYFQHVINPAAVTNGINYIPMHENEHTFSDVLFEALKTSLQEFVDPNMFGRNFIVLKNSDIGFGKGIDCTKLGFKEEYVHSRDGRSHHGCFVFGSKTKHRISSGAGRDEKDIDVQHFDDDVTAAVILKLDKKTCFLCEEDGQLSADEWEVQSSLWGQALLYARDVWRCLARRGLSVEFVPMVVLVGKTDSAATQHICCLDARLTIPKYGADCFLRSIDRMVRFDGTVAIPEQNDSCSNANTSLDDELPVVVDVGASMASASNSWDKLAIAVYIKTLRVGLERAFVISKNRHESTTLFSPVSLLCRKLLETNIDAQLIASPIPNANPFHQSYLKIHQGELFSVVSPTKDHFSSLKLYWFVDTECHEVLGKTCLVKVTSVSVHRTYVCCLYCKWAFSKLQRACAKKESLKRELAKVLLGYGFDELSFFAVMRDLRNEDFMVLNHQKIRQEEMLPALWTAFSVMVKSLLLPMAERNVVHMDIRSTAQITYNILCRVGGANDIELRLIDLDSLCKCSFGSIDSTRRDDSVHWLDIEPKDGNFWKCEPFPACRYLFWQVLWIAYTWYPRSVSNSCRETLPKLHAACHFVQNLWKDEHFVDFKEWLGYGTVKTLKSHLDEVFTAATVLATLDALGESFVHHHPL